MTFKKEEDRLALIWLIKAVIAFVILDDVIYDSSWFQGGILEPYTRVVAWELEKILSLLGYEILRAKALLTIQGLPYIIRISTTCAGLAGGFGIFVAVVLTLPAPSFRRRLPWLLVGTLSLTVVNLLRITAVVVLSFQDPGSFELFHNTSMDVNMLAGGLLSLLAVRSLSLAPRGIKVFRRSGHPNPAENKDASVGQPTEAS